MVYEFDECIKKAKVAKVGSIGRNLSHSEVETEFHELDLSRLQFTTMVPEHS